MSTARDRAATLRLQADARRRVQQLGLPRRLTLPQLVERAEATLGKRIEVRTADLPGDLSARLIQRRDHALLETRTGLSDRSRTASVLHELAHVFLADHGCDHEAWTGLLSGRTAFTRSLDTPHEHTVELVADELALHIGLLDPDERAPGIFR
ncbi:hypothetical protein JOE58_002793 [Curtobacterium luteum]|uniref:IrrE N-terminal-like domain-containing protein n=1 Tax=Curtobacterium luteum TaxID=33881 RepID=A0A8H9KY73_9MICO|nr:hypothetical protein [Curtobacterium luteum]MBM7803542.1 hypothetical protein [Curtobacterium luteum]NUU50184.1 hypothetical protein [Curtobacterium luteum]GGK99761.1 hypothetical protein GCM10009769_17420 [Curtobacterium luteum]